jgi:hypothetical protein
MRLPLGLPTLRPSHKARYLIVIGAVVSLAAIPN